MSHAAQSRRLKDHIAGLETMTRFVLATLALASGVYTYLGVRSLLDGSATVVFFAAVIYSASVSVAIYGFWTYLIRFLPEMRDGGSRLALLGIMAIGSAMIVAMASWLNAAALAGSAAVEQHLAITIEEYTADLDQAHSNALGALSLLPDIQRAGERFARLAADEQNSGALTGTSGSGSVVQLLSQMSAQMKELETTIQSSREPIVTAFEQGQKHLATMRGLVSAPGPIEQRSDQFAAESVALTGVIASLEQTSIAASVTRAAADLSVGFIAPVADGMTPELAGRQDQVMATIRGSVAAQSKALSDAAAEILDQPKVPERRYVPLTSAEAVLRYAGDFIPSWAGAISIDLLPAVLVGIMAVVHGVMRRGEDDMEEADRITAGDMLRSLKYNELLQARLREQKAAESNAADALPTSAAVVAEAAPQVEPARPEPPMRPTTAENVTPLSLSDRKRFDPMSLPGDIREAGLPGEDGTRRNLLVRYLSRFDDGEVLRWAFRGLLIGAISVLAIDLRDLAETNGWAFAGIAAPANFEPVLPPAVDIGVPDAPSTDPRPFLTTEESLLGKPMSFTLEPGGRLKATGSIQPGTADHFAAEMNDRGEYVKTISLNSPGGALDDAMAMARLIRERGLDTEVADGALCASSCPLLMAGGKHRAAGDKAAIGVHQFYAAAAIESAPEQIMADAQATTARISRHLSSMDVDPALWLHALDTPRALYYFSHEELASYRLVTGADIKTAKKK